MKIDLDLARATDEAKAQIRSEIETLKDMVGNEKVKITRSLLLEKLRGVEVIVDAAVQSMAERAETRMTEYDSELVEKAKKETEEANERTAEVEAKFATALRVLEDADVNEHDLIGIENQVNPIQILFAAQQRRRAAGGVR